MQKFRSQKLDKKSCQSQLNSMEKPGNHVALIGEFLRREVGRCNANSMLMALSFRLNLVVGLYNPYSIT